MSNPMINVAVTAARAAGRVIQRNAQRVEGLAVQSKERNDFVSDVDRQAEQEIIRILRRAYPHHGILAEESGERPGDECRWIIDPLDGTTNYLHQFPHYAVSIGFERAGRLELGVIYDPRKDELFTASRGEGALLDGRRIRVNRMNDLNGTLLGTGIPFRAHNDMDAYLQTLKVMAQDSAGIRRAGSAALDLAYVACGRLDGFWEFALKPWDIAAGVVLVMEAGGRVGDLSGGTDYMNSGDIVAAGPRVFEAMSASLLSSLHRSNAS